MQIYDLMFIFARRTRVLHLFAGSLIEKMEDNIKCNSLKAWLLASRPKTLAGASVPLMVALASAWSDVGSAGFRWIPALLCVLFAFVMQIDANFINDYFDFASGKDDEERLGPPRACAMGWIKPGAMKVGIAITTLLACAVGLPLVWFGGMAMIWVGVLCVVFCFLYTTLLASRAMGDLLVLLFFGLVPVCVSYYLQTGFVSPMVAVDSVSCGLVIDTLLVVNNYRDIDNDRCVGKCTLIVLIGKRSGQLLYLFLGVAACLLGIVHLFVGGTFAFVLPLLYLSLHVGAYRRMVKIDSGRQLNDVLSLTARNMFVYGLLIGAGLLIG